LQRSGESGFTTDRDGGNGCGTGAAHGCAGTGAGACGADGGRDSTAPNPRDAAPAGSGPATLRTMAFASGCGLKCAIMTSASLTV